MFHCRRARIWNGLPRAYQAVCVALLGNILLASCARTAAPRLPTAGKTGQEFERAYLGSRLHHHAETQNIVNSCIAKSQRSELVAFCKEINATADRVIGQLRERAKEWYGITIAPEADEEHASEFF